MTVRCVGQSVGQHLVECREPLNTKSFGIKKPACGRLLGGGFGLFLVNRTHLQFGHPALGVWVWDAGPKDGCLVVNAAQQV